MKYVILIVSLALLVGCVPIPAEPPPEPVPDFLDSAVEAGLLDLASVFARHDSWTFTRHDNQFARHDGQFARHDGQTDVTEYVDVLLSIRDCITNDLGDFAADLGLETEAGHTGYVAYLVGVLRSAVMYHRHMAVESGEVSSFIPDDNPWRGQYHLLHLKWTLAYCEDSGEHEWMKTE